jgi:outer membrane protein assembly factor BamD (BamD/ComL family)
MQQQKLRIENSKRKTLEFLTFALLVFSSNLPYAVSALVSAKARAAVGDTWHLGKDQDWKPVSAEGNGKFLLAVAETKKLVNTGQTKAARKAFDKLKKDFPEIAGPDLDLFIQAEIAFCEGNFTKAVRSHDKLLTEYPQSELRAAALDRQFAIAKEFLAGRKRRVLRIFKIKGYAEGIRIMERITDRVGIDTPMGLKAAIAVAENYEKRGKFNEEFLKWWEISSRWDTGQIGKDALFGMARCKHAVYNKHPEHKRSRYDASNLITARSYYEKFQLLYPKDAEEIGIDRILKEIDEQLANKQFAISQYYQRTANRQAANLYYNMVKDNWPDSKAAKIAEEMLTKNLRSEETKK